MNKTVKQIIIVTGTTIVAIVGFAAILLSMILRIILPLAPILLIGGVLWYFFH